MTREVPARRDPVRARPPRQPGRSDDGTADDLVAAFGRPLQLRPTATVVRPPYWLAHAGSLVPVQLTTYGPHVDAVAVFDAVATTFRWSE